MNILITSPGRRVEIIEYFKKEISKFNGKVYAADMNKYAPALYVADSHFIVDKDFDQLNKYVDDLIEICKKNNINYIMTLIDPELKLFSDNYLKFKDANIKVLISEDSIIHQTFDKFLFYEKFKNKINLVKTFKDYNDTIEAIKKSEITFPILVKDRYGSGSSGINKIGNYDELDLYKYNKDKIFQPFISFTEYGVDVYFDSISKKIVSLFIKEKISMRGGETDKAKSVYKQEIVDEILKLQNIKGFSGVIDVDVFETNDGKIYINEINPRFGGGYPHAYNCGINFIEKIVNNMNNIQNEVVLGDYKKNIIMMKYNGLLFLDDI